MCLGLIVLALTVRISPDTLIVCVVKPGALIQVDMACMEPVSKREGHRQHRRLRHHCSRDRAGLAFV